VRYARTVSNMVSVPEAAGRGAGGFLGGLFNNPGVVILGGLAIALVFFSGDIRKAFGSLGESIGSIGDIQLPSISLPDITFPSIDFPDITFPSFDIDFPDFSNIFGGAGEALGAAGEATGDFFAGLTDQFNEFIAGFTPKEPLTEEEQFDFSSLEGGVSPTPTGETPDPFRDAARFAEDFPETFVPIAPTPEPITVAPSLLDEVIAPFTGGGVSFEGGTIFQTPIENLSLSQIIDQFDVTASQAANLRAIAQGFTPEEEAFLSQGQEISPLGDIASEPAVSDPQFQGLTPEQIFAQLVGGNISNF